MFPFFCVSLCVCVCVYIYIYIYTHTHTYTYTHRHTHTHTHIYIYIYIYIYTVVILIVHLLVVMKTVIKMYGTCIRKVTELFPCQQHSTECHFVGWNWSSAPPLLQYDTFFNPETITVCGDVKIVYGGRMSMEGLVRLRFTHNISPY